MSDLAKCVTLQEQRSFLKINYLLGVPKYQVEMQLKKAVGNNAMKRNAINKWYKKFKSGRTKTEDEIRSGRQKTATDDQHQELLRTLLEESRGWNTTDLRDILGISS